MNIREPSLGKSTAKPVERSELNFKHLNHFTSSRDFAITTLATRAFIRALTHLCS